jgi:hypothetical protein
MNMKAILSIITISAVAALLNSPVLRGQETAPDAEGAAQAAKEELAKAKAEAQSTEVKAQKAQAEAQVNLASAQLQVERSQRDMAQASMGGGMGGSGGNKFESAPGFSQRLQNIVVRAPDHNEGRTLVIRSSDTDLKEQAELEKDLAVMSHILEKAASERAGGRGGMGWGGRPMGIDVLYAPEASPLRSLYLEGYGVLFMLNVGFPVLPPPQAEEQPEKTETTSDWEEAKAELYGQGGGGRMTTEPSEPYDKERVNRLKDGVLESLKNATNIRDLKPDDLITVCVFGGPSAGQGRGRTAYVKRSTGSSSSRNNAPVFAVAGGPMRQTIMTIRVKKSDADAFAKGTITPEAFHKRAHVVTYAGSPESGMTFGGGGMGGFGGGFGGGAGMGGGGFGGGGVKR